MIKFQFPSGRPCAPRELFCIFLSLWLSPNDCMSPWLCLSWEEDPKTELDPSGLLQRWIQEALWERESETGKGRKPRSKGCANEFTAMETCESLGTSVENTWELAHPRRGERRSWYLSTNTQLSWIQGTPKKFNSQYFWLTPHAPKGSTCLWPKIGLPGYWGHEPSTHHQEEGWGVTGRAVM